jgi:hypothetical protein
MPSVELSEEDHRWLLNLIERARYRAQREASIWVDELGVIDRVRTALLAGEPEDEEPEEPPAPKPRRKRRSTAERLSTLPQLCPEHPVYGALRPPRSDCSGCWKAYERLNGPAKTKQARLRFDRLHRA